MILINLKWINFVKIFYASIQHNSVVHLYLLAQYEISTVLPCYCWWVLGYHDAIASPPITLDPSFYPCWIYIYTSHHSDDWTIYPGLSRLSTLCVRRHDIRLLPLVNKWRLIFLLLSFSTEILRIWDWDWDNQRWMSRLISPSEHGGRCVP